MTIEYSVPTPCNLGRVQISELAESLAQDVGYKIGSDLEKVISAQGGKIAYQDIFNLDSSCDGSIQIENDNDFTIYLANHTSETRDRFTICHELGHYALHYLYNKHVNEHPIKGLKAERYGKGPCEFEANWFAAAFLMPKDPFTSFFNEVAGSISLLAAHFNVSSQSAEVRAKVLGLR